MCCSNSRPASIPSRRSPTCARRWTRRSATCRATPTSRRCRRSISRSTRCWSWRWPATCRSARCCASCARDQECHRAGARRHFGRDSRRARRGGRDRRRADADEELRRLARAAHRDHAAVEQPCRRRRARRRHRPLRREGAGADREAAGHAEDSGRGELRRGGDARRRRAGEADLQGRDLGHARQRPARHDHRGVEAHRREPDRDRRRREIRRRAAEEAVAGGDCRSPTRRTSRRPFARCWPTCRTRSSPACCWSRSSSCSRSASAPRCSSASRSPPRSSPACSGCSSRA